MNPLQQVRQLAWLLSTDVWPDGAAEVVFPANAVRVVSGDDPLYNARYPMALCLFAGSDADPQSPELLRARYRVIVMVKAEGQDQSQAATIGAQRTRGVGSSQGRGVMEIMEQVQRRASLLTGADGVAAGVRSLSAAQTVEIDGKAVAGQEIEFEALATVRRYYHSPLFLVGTGGSGQVALTWTNAPTRWDQYSGTTRLAPIIRYASGATAPASATAGTGVAGISAGDTAKTVTGLSAGTYSFAIFQPYTESGGASAERYSTQELSTTALSITVTA